MADRIEKMLDPASKCLAAARALNLISRAQDKGLAGLADKVERQIGDSLEVIDAGWTKKAIAYDLAAILAKGCPEHSRRFLKIGQELKSTVRVDSPDAAWTYLVSLG